jgi:hypothetical protein
MAAVDAGDAPGARLPADARLQPHFDLISTVTADVTARAPDGPRPAIPLERLKVFQRAWSDDALPTVHFGPRFSRSSTPRKVTSSEVWNLLCVRAPLVAHVLQELGPRVVLAGGAVGALISEVAWSVPHIRPDDADYDLFVVTDDQEEAEAIRHRVVAILADTIACMENDRISKGYAADLASMAKRGRSGQPSVRVWNPHLNVETSAWTTTIQTQSFQVFGGSTRVVSEKIQVIHRRNPNIADILCGFDLGSSAVGLVYDGTPQVYTSLMGRFAFEYAANVLDPTRVSTSYAARIEKYGKRGFALICPELNPDAVKDAGEMFNMKRVPCRIPRVLHLGCFSIVWGAEDEPPALFTRRGAVKTDYGFTDDYTLDERNLKALRSGEFNGLVVTTELNGADETSGLTARPTQTEDKTKIIPAVFDAERFAECALTVGPHAISEHYIVHMYNGTGGICRKIEKGELLIRHIRRYLPEFDTSALHAGISTGVNLPEAIVDYMAAMAAERDRILAVRGRLEYRFPEWPMLEPATAQAVRLTGSFHPVAMTPEELGGEHFLRHPKLTPLFESILPIARSVASDTAGDGTCVAS